MERFVPCEIRQRYSYRNKQFKLQKSIQKKKL